MKKIVGKATAMAMAVAMMSGAAGLTALASSTTTDKSQSAKVTYDIEMGFDWSIHSDVKLQDNMKVTGGTVAVNKNTIPYGEYIQISASGSGTDGAFTIKDSNGTGNKSLSYNVYVDDSETKLVSGGQVLKVDAGKTGSTTMYFELGSHDEDTSGSYSGTITYTVQAYKSDGTKVDMPN